MQPEASVIVPTYREAENLVVLIPRITRAMESAHTTAEIIVVDDDSNDGTFEVCERLRSTNNVKLKTRKNQRGLATAVLHGLREARGEILVVMDADLSHPPEMLPDIIGAVRNGAEMAVGSRYVAGGVTEKSWGAFRWLNSRAATILARPLTSLSDPMAGFFAVRRSVLSRAGTLNPIGYKIGLEILVKCGCRLVKEVPIHFVDRTRGVSKMGLREQWNYLVHLMRLYEFKFSRRFDMRELPT